MKRFQLVRDVDISGVSGTGVVAEVVEFTSGKVALSFLPHTAGIANIIIYDELAHVERIHGHNGSTRLEAIE